MFRSKKSYNCIKSFNSIIVKIQCYLQNIRHFHLPDPAIFTCQTPPFSLASQSPHSLALLTLSTFNFDTREGYLTRLKNVLNPSRNEESQKVHQTHPRQPLTGDLKMHFRFGARIFTAARSVEGLEFSRSSSSESYMYSGNFTIKIGSRQYRVCRHYRVSLDR